MDSTVAPLKNRKNLTPSQRVPLPSSDAVALSTRALCSKKWPFVVEAFGTVFAEAGKILAGGTKKLFLTLYRSSIRFSVKPAPHRRPKRACPSTLRKRNMSFLGERSGVTWSCFVHTCRDIYAFFVQLQTMVLGICWDAWNLQQEPY